MIESLCRKLDAQIVEINFWQTLIFICVQKINFISNLFFEYCKDIANLLFWELGILSHPHQNYSIHLHQAVYLHAKKINFITNFFLKMLQRNSNLFTLGMPGLTHSKWHYQFEETLEVYPQAKNQLPPSRFPWGTVVLDTLGAPGYAHPKWYYHLAENFRVCLQAKNELHPPCFSGNTAKISKLLYGVLWVLLVTQSQNDSIIRQKTSIFICMPKVDFTFTSFSRFYILNNPATWLADSILAHSSRTRIFLDMWLVVKYE